MAQVLPEGCDARIVSIETGVDRPTRHYGAVRGCWQPIWNVFEKQPFDTWMRVELTSKKDAEAASGSINHYYHAQVENEKEINWEYHSQLLPVDGENKDGRYYLYLTRHKA